MLSQMTFGAKKTPEEEIARDYPHQVADDHSEEAQALSHQLTGQTGQLEPGQAAAAGETPAAPAKATPQKQNEINS